MDRTDFLAIVESVLTRWPFSDKEEFMRTRWVRGLWNDAQRWNDAQAEAFAVAVETRIGDPKQFGRPAAETIIRSVWVLTGTTPVSSTDVRYSEKVSPETEPREHRDSPLQKYIDSLPPPNKREPACGIEKERKAAIEKWEANRR